MNNVSLPEMKFPLKGENTARWHMMFEWLPSNKEALNPASGFGPFLTLLLIPNNKAGPPLGFMKFYPSIYGLEIPNL